MIKSIRFAVTDVLAPGGDWKPVLQRVNGILRPGRPDPAGDVTVEELAAVEAISRRGRRGSCGEAGMGAGQAGAESGRTDELARLTRERDSLKALADRLAGEKTALRPN